MGVEGTEERCPSQTRQVSHLKHWEGTCEDGTGWRLNRHRDSLDITDEELSTSIVSVNIKTHYYIELRSILPFVALYLRWYCVLPYLHIQTFFF